MSGTGTQNEKIILKIRVGTRKFTWNGMAIPHIGRYSGLIWHNLGLKSLDAQAVFPLSTNEG
jgi:hypothetical protein